LGTTAFPYPWSKKTFIIPKIYSLNRPSPGLATALTPWVLAFSNFSLILSIFSLTLLMASWGPVGFSALESKVVISAHLEETSSGVKGRSKRAP
jgi:hypothetical protein